MIHRMRETGARLGVPWIPLALWLALVAVGPSACTDEPAPLPTDQHLVERFERIRGDLEAIRSMSDQDASMTRIGREYKEYWPISRERFGEYRALFEKIDCPGGLFRRDGTLYVICRALGFLPGTMKGYAFAVQVEASHVAPDLDMSRPREGRPYFRPISNSWYLFID